MDYNDVEFVAFWVMSLAPSVLLTVAGIVAHKRSCMWIPGYLILGILGCFIYAAFLGALIVQLFPPPDVPGLSGGAGTGPPWSGIRNRVLARWNRRRYLRADNCRGLISIVANSGRPRA